MYLILLFILCILGYISRRRRVKSPPAYPGRLPIIGHIYQYIGMDRKNIWNFYRAVIKECKKQGGLVTISIGHYDQIIITEPEDAVTLANACPEKHYLYNFLKPWLGEGLLTARAMTYKRTRKIMNSAFTQQVLVGLLDVFWSQSELLTKELVKYVGSSFNPEHLLLTNNLKTICKTSLGVDAEHHKAVFNEYTKALGEIFMSIFERFHKVWLHFEFIFYFSEHKRKQDGIVKTLHHLSGTILQQRKAAIIAARSNHEKLSDNFTPLLDKVLELTIDQGLLTESEIRDEVDTIILGGHDTTATTLNYVLVLLGSHPAIQEKTYKEIIEVMGDANRAVDKLDIPKLVYLECVIKETLRLYPMVPSLARTVSTDVQLKNYTIPAGSSIVLSTWAVHRHPMWGADAEQFRPERWLEPNNLPNFNRAFMAFGAAKRSCIGKTYAMMSMKTSLVCLLRRFKITADVSKLTLRMDIMLKPQSGHDIKLEMRK